MATIIRDTNQQPSAFLGSDGTPAQPQLDAAGNIKQQVAILGYAEDVLFAAFAITDTAQHNSTDVGTGGIAGPANCRGYKGKAIFVTSTLNQSVALYVDVSRDGVTWATIGNAASIPAGTFMLDSNETGASPGNTAFIAGLGNPWPYLRLHAICGVAPTSGTLSAWLEKMAG